MLCGRIFPEQLSALRELVQARKLRHHHAPLFGASMRALGVERTAARQLFLSQTLRNFLFAAVRIGVAGTHHAQRLQWELTRVLDDVLRTCAELREDEIAQTAPLADLVGSMHDRLYSRLFQS